MQYEVKIYKANGEKDFVVLNESQYKALQDDVVGVVIDGEYKMRNGDLVVVVEVDYCESCGGLVEEEQNSYCDSCNEEYERMCNS